MGEGDVTAYRENPRAIEMRATTMRLLARAQGVAERRRARRLAGLPIVVGYVVASAGSLVLAGVWERVGPINRALVAGLLLAAPVFAVASYVVRSANNRLVRARLGDRAFSEAAVPAAEVRAALRAADHDVGTRMPIVGVTCVAVAAQVLVEPRGMLLMLMVSMLVVGPLWAWIGPQKDLGSRLAMGLVALFVSGAAAALANVALGGTRAIAMLATAWLAPALLTFAASRSVATEERALAEVRRALAELDEGREAPPSPPGIIPR
jgi:hypothetical protein